MLVLLLCTLALTETALTESPEISTSQGRLRGQVLQSRGGRDYFSFTRVPYAKPPIGERRFKISERAGNWTDILDATQPIPSCIQRGTNGSPYTGQEDCLYLNIFTPNITGRLPVIFSIHGGGFLVGSAGLFNSAEFFMDEDVVFVAPNYRLSILGFLSLEDDKIPGNMGLKDQALALEWVHKEISAFGGDPNMITVIGESAGGVSSNLVCSAPRTNGLIKGCISQSGDSWSHWAYQKPGLPRERALNLIKAVGCAESKDHLKCLQSKPVELVANISLLSNGSVGLSIVTPVLEPKGIPGALLTVYPPVAEHSYPWIVGICQDDGLLFTYEYEYNMTSQENIQQFINDFNNTVVSKLNLESGSNYVEKIRKRFFKNGVEPLKAIRNFFSESMFLYPAFKELSKQSGPTYFYIFNYTGGPQVPFESDHVSEIGVGHAAEMPYFFNGPYRAPQGWPSAADVAMSKQLVNMWVNFARNQIPSSEGVVEWSQFKGKHYLQIQNSGITLEESTQYQEILDFWKDITPRDQTSESSARRSSFLLVAILSIYAVFKGFIL